MVRCLLSCSRVGAFAELLGQEGPSLLLNPDPLPWEAVALLLLSKALGLTSQRAASLMAEDTGGILPGSPAAQQGWGSPGHGEPCSRCWWEHRSAQLLAPHSIQLGLILETQCYLGASFSMECKSLSK